MPLPEQRARKFLLKSPKDMDRVTGAISLQNQHGRSFMKLRIVFYYTSVENTLDSMSCKDAIGSRFIIAMSRYTCFAPFNQLDNSLQRSAHRGILLECR